MRNSTSFHTRERNLRSSIETDVRTYIILSQKIRKPNYLLVFGSNKAKGLKQDSQIWYKFAPKYLIHELHAILLTILFFVGGLTAVIWTDFVQTILMILGAFVLMVIGKN